MRWLIGNSVSADPDAKDPWFGPVRHASDYFHTIHDAAVFLIKNGMAYVDDLSAGGYRIVCQIRCLGYQ